MRPFDFFFLFIALRVILCGAEYNDGTIEASLTYEFDAGVRDKQEGRAILAMQAIRRTNAAPLLSVTSVLDISGSMEANKGRLELLKLVTEYMIEQLVILGERQHYGSVVFSDDVEEFSPLQKINRKTASVIENKMNNIELHGYTDLHAGLIGGIEQQREQSSDGYERMVLLFTDGFPTTGDYISPSDITESVNNILNDIDGHITVHVVAIGEQVSTSLLKEIADIGGGTFIHIKDKNDIPVAFSTILKEWMPQFARDVRYVIEPIGDLELTSVKINNAPIRWTDKNVVVDVGDLIPGEQRRLTVGFQLNTATEVTENGLRIGGSYHDAESVKDIPLLFEDKFVVRDRDIQHRQTQPVDESIRDAIICDLIRSSIDHHNKGNSEEAMGYIQEAFGVIGDEKSTKIDTSADPETVTEVTDDASEGTMEGIVSVPDTVKEVTDAVFDSEEDTGEDLQDRTMEGTADVFDPTTEGIDEDPQDTAKGVMDVVPDSPIEGIITLPAKEDMATGSDYKMEGIGEEPYDSSEVDKTKSRERALALLVSIIDRCRRTPIDDYVTIAVVRVDDGRHRSILRKH